MVLIMMLGSADQYKDKIVHKRYQIVAILPKSKTKITYEIIVNSSMSV
jgi:hypothetical protein